MQTLKFLGRGSAFNTKEGNTSAYYIDKDKNLLLIDCGENIFERILKKKLLDDVKNVHVLITHLNSDHVGSLSSLIYYCYYIKKNKVNVYFPTPELHSLLKLMGHKDNEYNFLKLHEDINFINNGNTNLFYEKIKHIDALNCFSYRICLMDANKIIHYSGDGSELNGVTLNCLKHSSNVIDEIYQDTSLADYEGNVHLSLRRLCELIPKGYRQKVYCMHIDNEELFNKAIQEGFNVVECV